jgi:hypothetical protein
MIAKPSNGLGVLLPAAHTDDRNHCVIKWSFHTGATTILDDPGQYLRAREGECELGTLAIGKTVSGTDFGDRMGAW